MGLAPLDGFVIGVTADRRAREQIDLLERRGARVVHGPTMGTAFFGDEDRLRSATSGLLTAPPDVFVANTGIGVRSWLDAAASWDVEEALLAVLSRCTVVARGPKAAGAVRRAGLTVHHLAGSERLDEVGELLVGLGIAGQRVVVQQHGEEHGPLHRRLVAGGADVIELPVYRWRLPHDREPALRLIDAVCSGRVDAITFTSAPGLRNLFTLACDGGRDAEVLRALNEDTVAVVCVGPVCADAAREEGIVDPVAPAVGRLGHLVRAVTDVLGARRRELSLAGNRVTVQGAVVRIGGESVTLTPVERVTLDALLGASGRVITKAELEQAVWGDVSANGHRLHVAVGRLRARLGPAGEAIEPVYGRGYRLVA
ncbi:MAG TPA: uroporphyrinogen-III synthase [Nitriliruptorales bacterium]